MTKRKAQKNKLNSRKSIGALIVVIVVLSFVTYWANWSIYLPPPSATVTSSQISSLPQSTAIIPLRASDFNLTSSSGCQFVNQTTSAIEFRFYFTLTNQFNENVHFVNASVAGILGVIGPKNQSKTFTSSLNSPTYTNALTLMVTVPSSAVPSGAIVVLSVSFVADVMEVNGAILKLAVVDVGQSYPSC
jgi:hypothetical protein